MPPLSPRSEHNDSFDENPPLTDENVAILYEIIKSAEQSPNVDSHPFRAIFSAYDEVLLENGLDSNHDQIYLRFLFRLGDRREESDSLFGTFEKLLDELGIQIEFNTEDEDIQEVTRNFAFDRGVIDEVARTTERSPGRARRRSTNSAYDAEDESMGLIQSPTGSRASESILQVSKSVAKTVRPASRATTRPTEKIANPSTPKQRSKFAARKRLTGLEWTQDLEERQRERKSLVDSRGRHLHDDSADLLSKLSTKGRHPAAEVSLLNDGHYPEGNIPFRNQLSVEDPPIILSNKEKFYSPSRTQLLRDAETFQSYRIRSVARDAVDKWCFAAMEAKDQHEYMQRVAIAHDKEILLRQALEHWRLRLHERKQAVQTMRYFQHLERRATKARDLYLLTKAFTHWVQCARDEALRLSLARQHILSIKYFHAWRDLTLANQDKVHKHGLGKYFEIWKRRLVQNVTNDIKADLAHQKYLMRSGYWHWFWGFCEARAPQWQARRLKQRTMIKWLTTFRMNRSRNQQVTIHIEIAAKRFFILKWLEKVKKTLSNQDIAVAHSRQNLTGQALKTWIRIHNHGPILQEVSNMIDWRVARATFTIFTNRYKQLKQAESLDQLRLKRNAWTEWNDHLRWQTLARQVDDRCVLQALYKWTIAERLKFFVRLLQGRLKEKYLLMLRDAWNMRDRKRNDTCRTIESQLTRRSLHLVISHWSLSCKTRQQKGQIAVDFYGSRVIFGAFNLLSQRFQYIRLLDKKAIDAAYYFRVNHSLHRWHTAWITSKREKRRNAYIKIRKKTKMRLASEMLERWHSTTTLAIKMEDHALQFDYERGLRIVARLFTRWKMLYDQTVEQDFLATSHFDERLLVRHFSLWSDRTSSLTELEQTAFQNSHLRQQKLALISLNRLRLRLIELKGPQATAENLRSRYEKRHFYNMIRLWQERTAHLLNRPTWNRGTFSSKIKKTKPMGHGDDRFSATARAEEWTELDQGEWIPQLEAQSGSTLLPYLNTPSKRAVRARAALQESTTPSTTPFQTRLGAQLSTTPKTTQRALFGRLKNNSPAPLVEGSGSTTVIDKDE